MFVCLVALTACSSHASTVNTEPAVTEEPAMWGSEDHMRWLTNCIEAKGFQVEMSFVDGSISVGPPSQAAAAETAIGECMDQAVEEGGVSEWRPPTGDELRRHYSAYHITQKCLIDNGYPVVTPPSEESYVESGGSNWHPWDGVPEAWVHAEPGEASTEAEFGAEVRRTCPANLSLLLPLLDENEK